jgi:hypothetical protein
MLPLVVVVLFVCCCVSTRATDDVVGDAHCISQLFGNCACLIGDGSTTSDDDACHAHVVDRLAYLAARPPLHAPNSACTPPAPTPRTAAECARHPEAFSGRLRTADARIGVVVDLGFDADVLEIALHEYVGVVDRVFIVESTRAHRGLQPKPLMWEKLRDQPRFEFARSVVVHIVLDDDESLDGNERADGIWTLEKLMNQRRYERIMHWNRRENGFFRDDDLISFGAADEIPARRTIEVLRACELRTDADQRVMVGAWFMMGDVGNVRRVGGPPIHGVESGFMYPSPMFHTVRDLVATGGKHADGVFARREATLYVLGGIHMTDYAFLPYHLLKWMTATEYGGYTVEQLRDFARQARDDVRALETARLHTRTRTDHIERAFTIEAARRLEPRLSQIMSMPYWYTCNPHRYPAFEGQHDTRVC